MFLPAVYHNKYARKKKGDFLWGSDACKNPDHPIKLMRRNKDVRREANSSQALGRNNTVFFQAGHGI